jgi:hypothetical protein
MNNKNEYIFCSVQTNEIRGSVFEPVKICVKSNTKTSVIAESNSWNWQQGCMLQWYADIDHTIIYNDFSEDKGNYVAKIHNINTGKINNICKPIYNVSKSGKFALTLNFDRLALMRPDYGYFNSKLRWDDLPEESNDGIWHINLMENKSKLILSLEQLKNFRSNTTMRDARHKVNHIDIAPDGNRFMFLHRWVGPQGRYMRLLSANCIDGSNLYYLIGDQMVSHSCWWGNKDIISFCRLEDGRNQYVHFKDLQGFVEIIGENSFTSDGHPSVSPDGRWMLTDDYPDKSRFSNLYLYDLRDKKKHLLGTFLQPLKYNGEKRIDLHPKWDLRGQQIAFESGHTGKRQLYILNIESIVNSEKKKSYCIY